MKNKTFTLFFLQAAGKKITKINFTTTRLVVLFSVFLLFCFFILYIVFDYISLKHRSFENMVLRAENNHLIRQIDQFQTKMNKIEDTLNRINSFAAKLKTIVLPDDPDRGGRLALGPISKYEFNNLVSNRSPSSITTAEAGYALPEEEDNSSLDEINLKLEMLQHASALQEQTLGQLQELIEDQKSLLRSTPALKPTDGWVTSPFGKRISPFTGLPVMHEGIDLATRSGTIIVSPADGRVTFAGVKPGYGNTLVIDHGYGIMTKYGHNAVLFVKAGDSVKRGDRIATVGSTGRSTGPHLHYEVSVNGIPRNPDDYILIEDGGIGNP